MHLVLVHGADIMETFELPIGTYSEEALEARNKHIRAFAYLSCEIPNFHTFLVFPPKYFCQSFRFRSYPVYREHKTRKCFRLDPMMDLFHRLFLTGDNVLSSIRLRGAKDKGSVPELK